MALQKPGASSTAQASTGDAWRDQRIAWNAAIEESRDRWGRPRIVPPEGGKPRGYRRASAYGAPLEDDTNLTLWKMRQVGRGVARSRALGLEITRAEVDLDGAEAEARAAKATLNEIVERAMDLVGSGDGASIGTSMHDVCELYDRGVDPGHVPEEFRADVAAYRELVVGFRMVSIERFIVQDGHEVAGTLDRAGELLAPLVAPDGTVLPAGSVIVVDQKTSQSMDFAGPKFGVQCWAYATGTPYDPVAKVRVPWGHAAPRTDWAVIAHTPSGQGAAALHWVDLSAAAEAAEVTRAVRAWRGKLGKALIAQHDPTRAVEDFHATAATAQTVDELWFAARRANEAGAWCEALRDAFSARKAELVAATAAGV